MLRALRGVFAVMLLASLGCGGAAKSTLYPVTGKVTVAGKPLVDCKVQFVSTKDPGIVFVSGIDATGAYELKDLQDGRSGAQPGNYKVTFQQSPDAAMKGYTPAAGGAPTSGPPAQTLPYPKEFSDPSTSTKEVEVKASPNTIDIVIP